MNWTIKPEYLLIVGAPNYIPYPVIGTVYTDNYYTNLTGDLHNEILSGRFTVHSTTECQTVVNKVLMYERWPDTTTTDWFRRGCLTVNVDNDYYDDSIYFSDQKYFAGLMVANGYNYVDSLSDSYGDNYNNIYSAVNSGRMFLLYRGSGTNNWYTPFDCNPDVVTNGKKLPIVLSMTCNTIGRSSTAAAAERWFLTGTPTYPRGGAGYFATTTSIMGGAYLRSAVAKGFADGVFTYRYRTFGQACEAGRSRVYQMYSSSSEYYGFNTIGDPEMNIWTAAPQPLTVAHEPSFMVGEDTINVHVQCAGVPVESALVCVKFDTVIYNVAYTDANGNCSWPLSFLQPGILQLTVTGRNYYPYERDLEVIDNDVFLSCGHNDVDDSLGNGNGIVEAGECVRLWIEVRNLGTSVSQGVSARLRTTDTLIYISDSCVYYGSIGGTDSSRGMSPYVFTMSPRARTHMIPFSLCMRDGFGNSWLGNFTLSGIGTGGGGNGTGPDPYGYYLYDDTDTSSGNAPPFNWYEIAPPAGGPGQVISEITNEDGDTVTFALPFSFKYYGIWYSTVGACSNGFLELGHSTTYTSTNTSIPQTGGPVRLLAGFWDNLNVGTMHMGHGDIFRYHDAANHRWIIEFYQAAHYDNNNAWETFQMILRDPQYYPTPTGDGEILFVYQTVEDPSSNSTGLEDETEQRGLCYLYNGGYDPDAAPLVSGRALLITTKPPFAEHLPWLYLLSYYIRDSVGGNNNGIIEPGEAVELAVTIMNGGDTLAAGVSGQIVTGDPDATIIDSLADFGDMAVNTSSGNNSDPYVIQISSSPADTTIGILLKLIANAGAYENNGYLTLYLSILNAAAEPGDDPLHKSVLDYTVFPNPARGRVELSLDPSKEQSAPLRGSGASSSDFQTKSIELIIYDITGRIIRSFTLSSMPSALCWSGTDQSGRAVPAGVYFIRLKAEDKETIKKVILLE
jgi:hypothetical protein